MERFAAGSVEPQPRVALVHDYLTQYGGAERVLEALHQLLPDSPIFTALYDPKNLPASFESMDIQPSLASRLPGAASHHHWLMPAYPSIFRQLGRQTRDVDLVIADSSAWAHHIGVRPDQILICYCHSPARFLYGDQDYLGPARLSPAARYVLSPIASALRRADRRAAARVDCYIANSRNVQARIKRVYGRDSRVIHPPVDLGRFEHLVPNEPEDWFLVVSRLVPHKRVDLVMEATHRVGARLKIVGTGRSEAVLRSAAGSNIEFLGSKSDTEVVELLATCRGLILPGAEDFGLTAVEAQAAGRPVIAYGKGGALESIDDGVSGLFFDQPTPSSLMDAIERFQTMRWSAPAAQANAARFGRDRFMSEMKAVVEEVVKERR